MSEGEAREARAPGLVSANCVVLSEQAVAISHGYRGYTRSG